MTLPRLLLLAGINRYQRFTYFAGCELRGPIVLSPDAVLARVITVAWLPQLRTVLADCEVRANTQAAVPVRPKPQTAHQVYRGQQVEPVKPRLW